MNNGLGIIKIPAVHRSKFNMEVIPPEETYGFFHQEVKSLKNRETMNGQLWICHTIFGKGKQVPQHLDK